mgnify:CR=1 FL=1
MIRTIKTIIIASALLAVTVVQAQEVTEVEQPGLIKQIAYQTHDTLGALVNSFITPLLTKKDIQCLARNIFHEAGGEPEEGKVAVGIVTLNRVEDPNFPKTVCGVVQQPKQFSWWHPRARMPKEDDPRWVESQRIAVALAEGEYSDYRLKYANAQHFHATYVRPGWRLKKVGRIGNHVFYE